MTATARSAQQSSAAFFAASDRILTERRCGDEIQAIMFVPGVVCAAFSVELGFKAMIMQAGAKAGGHNLLTLMRQRDRRGSLLPFGH